MDKQIYQAIANTLGAIANCQKSGNAEWEKRHSDTLDDLWAEAPSGSGVDCGTKLDDSSTPNRLVFNASFHHMDEHGGYDGWTEHQIIVTPDLVFGFDLRITGRNRNEIKDYLGELYYHWLSGSAASVMA